MKIRFFTLFLCLLTAESCSTKNSLVIDGKVSSDAFEGSKIYIVAPDGATQKYEDSALIRNRRFSVTLPSDSMALRTLSIPRKGNAAVEDLIFIKEKGRLDVIMSTKSSSAGTRLNEILMDWKRKNILYDSTQYDLYYRANIPGISKNDYDSLVNLSANTDSVYLSWVRKTLDNNFGNAVGLLFFETYYDQLPLDVKKTILNKTGDDYLKRNLHVWSKVMFDSEIPKENGSVKK